MLVFVEDAAEAVASADIEARDLLRVGHRFGKRAQGRSTLAGSVGPVLVVEVLELPQRMQEVALVPDRVRSRSSWATCLHPAFHDRIHPWHLDPAEHDRDARLLQDRVERAGNLPSRSRIRNRAPLPACSRSIARFLAAWTTQEDAG